MTITVDNWLILFHDVCIVSANPIKKNLKRNTCLTLRLAFGYLFCAKKRRLFFGPSNVVSFFPGACGPTVLLIVVVCCASWHLHVVSSSHLHIFSSSHLHIFTSVHLLLFSPSHFLIFSSALHIFPLTLLPSYLLALLPSCPLLFPSFSRLKRGAVPTTHHEMQPTLSHEMRGSVVKIWHEIAIFKCPVAQRKFYRSKLW